MQQNNDNDPGICAEKLEEDIVNDSDITLFVDEQEQYHVVINKVTEDTRYGQVTEQSVNSFDKYIDAYFYYRVAKTKL